jgi:hypothetical protein
MHRSQYAPSQLLRSENDRSTRSHSVRPERTPFDPARCQPTPPEKFPSVRPARDPDPKSLIIGVPEGANLYTYGWLGQLIRRREDRIFAAEDLQHMRGAGRSPAHGSTALRLRPSVIRNLGPAVGAEGSTPPSMAVGDRDADDHH